MLLLFNVETEDLCYTTVTLSSVDAEMIDDEMRMLTLRTLRVECFVSDGDRRNLLQYPTDTLCCAMCTPPCSLG